MTEGNKKQMEMVSDFSKTILEYDTRIRIVEKKDTFKDNMV